MLRIARVSAIMLLIAILLPAAFVAVSPGHASAILSLENVYVNGTTGNDSWDGSAPTARGGSVGPVKTIAVGISLAATDGTVHVAAGTYNEHGLDLNSSMNLVGDGALTTIINGNGLGLVLAVSSAPFQNNTISGFTIENGAPSGSDPGGGIYVSSAHILTINDCAIVNNTRGFGSGSKVDQGGGLCNDNGQVYMNRCTVSGNTAGTAGGGIANFCDTPSTDFGKMWLTNCTISGNTVTEAVGEGGGIFNSTNADATLLNVTIANNHATGTPSFGGGFGNNSLLSMYLKNCIVANNTAGDSTHNNGFDSLGTGTHSQGHNLSSDNSCYFNQVTDQVFTDPLLGPLQNNGGPTSTMAITKASPAYNRGTNDGAPATDQRGIARPQDGTTDIGAFELSTAGSSASITTNSGTATFTVSTGTISGLVNIPPESLSCASGGIVFPYGMFTFNITGVTPGHSVTVKLGISNPLPSGSHILKCQGGSLIDFSAFSGQLDPNDFSMTLTDGGEGDEDGLANGTIVDPCGPAFQISGPPQSSSAQVTTASQAPASIANIAVQSASLSSDRAMPGGDVTVTADVINRGNAAGSSSVKLYVNGQEEAKQGVSLASGGSTSIQFTVSRDEPGTYTVYVGSTPAGTLVVDWFADPNIVVYIGAAAIVALFIGVLAYRFKKQRVPTRRPPY